MRQQVVVVGVAVLTNSCFHKAPDNVCRDIQTLDFEKIRVLSACEIGQLQFAQFFQAFFFMKLINVFTDPVGCETVYVRHVRPRAIQGYQVVLE